MTKEKLNYILTGEESPRFITEREQNIIDKCLLLINEKDNLANDGIVKLEQERFEWALKTFPKATAVSSLRKLEEEIKEIESNLADDHRDPEEYADALMCLFDSAGRAGICPEEIFEWFGKKFEKNKKRNWMLNPDNTYSHIPSKP